MSGTAAGGVLQRGEDRWGHDGALQHCSTAALQHGHMSADNPVSPHCHRAAAADCRADSHGAAGAVLQRTDRQHNNGGGTRVSSVCTVPQRVQPHSHITHSESIEILNHSSFSYFLFWNRKKVRQKSLGIVGQLLKYQVSEN